MDESIAFQIILYAGNARSTAMEALGLARQKNFLLAEEKIEESNQELLKAHKFQTELIQSEARGELQGQISILLIHAQDHLMNAMTVRELASELIDLRQELESKESK
ncbi:PTS lactose/cellobiose transporter subunit IIA [Heyndrickxia oleronia]|uniref:PTS lactose/cellobiose transporter subunit IIA n=1 Tax=Heyndrickxia oleronia TaxID=38875 RepID=A0AAW6SY85_9BACI|nr:PTS lactose/cellobiose transporter subunit IIA [Heyndrickxia oleronia]MDH5162405.1 PTS lactose/cellobiose transporter subunit IIA [Heyndrickxia oleronia]